MIFALGWELSKDEIIKAVLNEFIARGLDKVYIDEIEEWKKYKREKKFAIKLDKEMKEEVKRFRKTIKGWKPKELKIIWDIIPHNNHKLSYG